MEATVWSDPQVLKRLQEEYVIVALYVDEKTQLSEKEWYTSIYDNKVKKSIGKQNSDLQIYIYGANAQPYYCLIGDDGKRLMKSKAYDKNVDNFIRFLDKGVEKYKEKYGN
jgi:thiol:disulfide interchange protein DsbD